MPKPIGQWGGLGGKGELRTRVRRDGTKKFVCVTSFKGNVKVAEAFLNQQG